jgi:hypothetical protein
LNLGVAGTERRHAEAVRRFVPELEPDLVITGLPERLIRRSASRSIGCPCRRSGRRSCSDARAWDVTNERSDALLRFGLRPDFHSELLAHFDRYRARFERDVQQMNQIVTASGRPPIVGVVLDHTRI